MVTENKVTIPAGELLRLFKGQYDRIGDILQCCEIMERDGTARKTGAVSVIQETAEKMRDDITALIHQFDDPATKGETHIIPPEKGAE